MYFIWIIKLHELYHVFRIILQGRAKAIWQLKSKFHQQFHTGSRIIVLYVL